MAREAFLVVFEGVVFLTAVGKNLSGVDDLLSDLAILPLFFDNFWMLYSGVVSLVELRRARTGSIIGEVI